MLVERAGACPAPEDSRDFGVPWHYGEPLREQRALLGGALVDLSHRGVVTITGPDRLSWLNSLSTQRVDRLAPGRSALDLVLSPHGHVEHELHCVEDGQTLWLSVEPGTAPALVAYLESMRFMLRVEVADVSAEFAVVGDLVGEHALEPSPTPTYLAPAEFAGTGLTDSGVDRGGNATKYVPSRPATFPARERILPRAEAASLIAGAEVAGTWAWEALRVAAAVPRFGFETDHRTLPHEVGWVGPAVHLAKGCYRGQEAVARVHNLGRPPRRLALLHLDGSDNGMPVHGDEVVGPDASGPSVGWVASVAQHHELGPIATAVLKRNATVGEVRVRCGASGDVVAAAQELVVAP